MDMPQIAVTVERVVLQVDGLEEDSAGGAGPLAGGGVGHAAEAVVAQVQGEVARAPRVQEHGALDGRHARVA